MDYTEYTVRVYHNRREWRNNHGELHGITPAVEYNDGRKEWFWCGMRHRTNGAGVITADGEELFWLNGFSCSRAAHAEMTKNTRTVE